MNKLSNEMIRERLRTLREGANLTQEALAGELHYSRSLISELETGKTGLSVGTLISYSTFFNVSADYILCGITPYDFAEDILSAVESALQPFMERSKYN